MRIGTAGMNSESKDKYMWIKVYQKDMTELGLYLLQLTCGGHGLSKQVALNRLHFCPGLQPPLSISQDGWQYALLVGAYIRHSLPAGQIAVLQGWISMLKNNRKQHNYSSNY